MVYREKLNQLLADVQELESLIGKLLTEEVPGVQLLSKSSSCAYSILEGIKEIESEQIRQMNARLVERQDELSHLSVLLDQYQRMAEACKKIFWLLNRSWKPQNLCWLKKMPTRQLFCRMNLSLR